MNRWTPALLAAALLAAGVAAADTNAAEVELEHSLQTRLVTPHEDWSRGYVRGPIRALCFVYMGAYDGTWADEGTRLREVVELGERFDLQADAVYYGGSGARWDFHGNKLGADRAERLLSKPYQLYVLAGFSLDKLPAKMQYEILSQVARGAGLLCCGPGSEYLVEKRKLALPPALDGGLPVVDGKPIGEWATAYRLGRGRGVWLRYGTGALLPTSEFSFRRLHELDYWLLLVGRAAQWAAGLDNDVQVSLTPGGQPLHVARGSREPAGEVVISSGHAGPATLSLKLVRPEDGLAVKLADTPITLAAGKPAAVPVSLPRLRAGSYYLNAIVTSKRGAEACGAATLAVDSDCGVAQVSLDNTYVEPGKALGGTAVLRGTPPADSTVRVRFRDGYGRVLAQQDLPVKAGQAEYRFRYEATAAATIGMGAEAVLLSAGAEVELGQAAFTVPKRRQGQMNFTMWDTPNDPLGYYVWQQLKAAGYNISLIGSMGEKPRPAPEVLKACDVTIAPYSTRILDPKDENGYMKPVCWNDAPAVDEYVQKIVDNQVLLRQAGVFVYSLGDEGVTAGCCTHPACLAAYRRWLQDQYGDVAALNNSWGTSYGSFGEVALLDPKDNLESAAQKTNFPRWYDRQAFARYNLMQFAGRFGKAYDALDPKAKTGFEGTGGYGDDFEAIMGLNRFYGPYPSIGDDILRSAYPRDRVRSNWMGYSKTGDALSDAAWRMVMKNMDSVWYWMWSGIGSFWGYVRPTFDYFDATADVTAEMRPVREGLGDLLLQTEVADSRLAFLYSLPSALASGLEDTRDFTSGQADHELWTQLTYECGLDFRYVTDHMLLDGALQRGGYKVLWLPLSQALSAAQAEVIRQFVKGGGTVIADLRPGLYDAHCKPLERGLLDDVFGIRRSGRGKSLSGTVNLDTTIAERRLKLSFPNAKVDPGVQAAGAEEIGRVGQTPVLLVNNYGAGRAVLLNFTFASLKAEDEATMQVRELLSAIYAAGGARAPLGVASPAGKPLPLTESRTWRNGQALVFGLWRQMQNAWFAPKSGTQAGAPVPARVTLPAPAHVYDLRAGKYLGKVSRLETRLRWGRANFFAALPYKLGPTTVSLSGAVPQAGQDLIATVKLGVPAGAREKHAVYVEVIDPAGRRPLWGRWPVVAEQGQARVAIPVAYNDQPGKWTVRATELFSRQAAEASWTIK